MKKYLLLIDGNWENATLSKENVDSILKDINGTLNKDYTITLENGEFVDVSSIDSIKEA